MNLLELKSLFDKDDDIRNIYNTQIVIDDVILDEMPKYAGDNIFSRDFSPRGMTIEFQLKEAFNNKGMYGFVSWRWINPFVEWLNGRKCLEVMCGRGWLSYALQQKGIDVIATDDMSWSDERGWEQPLVEAERLDAIDAVNKYGKDIDVLIMSWAYMDNVAYKVIKRLNEVNPAALVLFIGEGKNGCTADEEFFDHFEEIKDEFFDDKVAPRYQKWAGLHDHLQLGKYVEQKSEDRDELVWELIQKLNKSETE